jgi:2,4'-dihydroxyacetophenone dioxygenase
MDVTTLLPSHDAMFRWDAPWIEQSPMTSAKVLWVGRETGSWALLGLWKAGYVASRHQHLAAAHVFVVSGTMASGDVVMTAGDYIYEPSGVMHEATTAIEDTVQLFISLGPIARLDAAGGITSVTTWQDIESLRQSHVNST